MSRGRPSWLRVLLAVAALLVQAAMAPGPAAARATAVAPGAWGAICHAGEGKAPSPQVPAHHDCALCAVCAAMAGAALPPPRVAIADATTEPREAAPFAAKPGATGPPMRASRQPPPRGPPIRT